MVAADRRSSAGAPAGGSSRDGRLHAGNLVWIFGTAKTGTSWLSAMLADAPGYAQWREPNVGNLFGGRAQHRPSLVMASGP